MHVFKALNLVCARTSANNGSTIEHVHVPLIQFHRPRNINFKRKIKQILYNVQNTLSEKSFEKFQSGKTEINICNNLL